MPRSFAARVDSNKKSKKRDKTMVLRKTDKTYKNLGEVKEKFPNVLRTNRGRIYKTCEELKISPQTYYDWRDSDPEFKLVTDQAHLDADGEFVEKAISKLWEQVEEGKLQAIIYALDNKGKTKGYNNAKVIEIGNKEGETFKSELSQAQIDAIIRAAHDPRYKHD